MSKLQINIKTITPGNQIAQGNWFIKIGIYFERGTYPTFETIF